MLLITRGADPKTESEIFEAFSRYLFETGLVAPSFRKLLYLARDKNYPALVDVGQDSVAFADVIAALYASMDNAFNFKAQAPGAAAPAAVAGVSVAAKEKDPAAVKDFRGVACPMNFVKTKVELAKLKTGDILEIWLDDGPPIENVRGSVKAESHKIVAQKQSGRHWSAVIEKA